MRLALTVLVTLSLAAGAQDRIKRVTFACEPADARVYLESSTHTPYLLGPANQPIALDMSLFDGRQQVAVTFRREGWVDETRVLQPSGSESHFFDSRERYPDASQGPVRLSGRPDLPSRAVQAGYYLRADWPFALGLGLAALGLGWRWRVLKAGHTRAQELEGLVVQEVGGYRLGECLGSGGMASVYRGVKGDEVAAVKLMHPHCMEDPAQRRRFRRETEIYRDLSHRNILRLYDAGEQDGRLYLVLELLEGETLRQRLKGRRLERGEVLQYARPLADAMDYAHSKRIIHRDLKPENIFLCKDGRLVVMDFGIARGGDYTQATATGEGLGTPFYMAPEQLRGNPEPASDLYAFGVMLFEMFSGSVPFQGEDTMAVAYLHVGQQPPDLAELCPGLPPQVAPVVARLLAKDPQKRYASFAEAVAAL